MKLPSEGFGYELLDFHDFLMTDTPHAGIRRPASEQP